MTDLEQETAAAVPETHPSAVIRSWMPGHAHESSEFLGDRTWSWSTPAGVWTICMTPFSLALSVRGPGGLWNLGSASKANLARLFGVLLGLGALEGPLDVVEALRRVADNRAQ